MSYWEKKPIRFRVIIAVLTTVMVGLGFFNFYKLFTASTDENTFSDPATRFYVMKMVPALELKPGKESIPAFIKPGALLIDINGAIPKGLTHLYNLISKSSGNSIKIRCLEEERTFEKGFVYLKQQVKYYVVNKKDIPNKFITYLYSAVYVRSVEKGGASERAGIRPGDYILKINNKTFNDALSADRILRSGKTGSVIEYEILRNGTSLIVDLKLAKYGIATIVFINLINGLIFIGLGAFLAIKRPRFKAARLLGTGLILFGYGLLYVRYSFQSEIPGFYYLFTVTIFISQVLAYPVLFQTLLYFPKELPSLINRRWIVIIPYIVSCIVILVFILIIAFEFLPSLYKIHASFIFSASYFNSILFDRLWLIALLIYAFIIRFVFRKEISPEYKQTFKYLSFFTYLLIAYNVLGAVYFIYVGDFVLYNSYLIPVYPFLILYTVGRYGLLNLNIRIRRNIQYTLVSILWKIAIFAMVFASLWVVSSMTIEIPNIQISGNAIEILEKPLSPEKHDLYVKLLLINMSIIGAYLFWVIYRKIQEVIDKKYFRTRFDYKQVSNDFSEIIAKNISITDLSQKIITLLTEMVKIKKAGILLIKDEEKLCCSMFTDLHGDNFREFAEATMNKFKDAINEYSNELSVEYLPQPLKSVYREHGFVMVFPIRYKSKLIGALLVGEKLAETSYIREDIQFLSSIAKQCAISIENSFLYEEVTQRERLRHELDIARNIQTTSLPQKVPVVENLDISGISSPAFEVGGDFYDYLEMNGGEDGNITVIVGDVSGKGTSAALYMSKVQGIFRTLHEYEKQPRNLLIQTNKLLYQSMTKRSFVTAIAANFDSVNYKVRFARAGHIPMYYYNSSEKQVEKHAPKGIGLGMNKGTLIEQNLLEVTINYNPGDVFLFVTDGIMDARNSQNREFSEENLIKVFEQNINLDAKIIRNNILESVRFFTGPVEQFDDITIVVVKAK